MENDIMFSTKDTGDYELNVISMLLTQARNDEQIVIRACEYVLDRLKEKK